MDLAAHGILTHRAIGGLLTSGVVTPSLPWDPIQRQPTTLDLRLGTEAWRVPAGFLPRGAPVSELVAERAVERLDLTRGAVLQRDQVYLVRLAESVALPPDLSARANPRSSTGRIDVFTRTLVDGHERFDDVPAGYHGPLWVEVFARSFDVRVATGTRLNQLRFVRGRRRLAEGELARRVSRDDLLCGAPLPDIDHDALLLGLSLRPDRRGDPVGWRARTDAPPLDLTTGQQVDPAPWFEPVFADARGGLVLEPEAFTLLAGSERVRVPPDLAAEMLAWDVGMGELRTNYAGFFDPGFGWGPGSPRGAAAVLEVRCHDVAFRVEHGQPIYRLWFGPTVEPCDQLYGGPTSAYQNQDLALARYFRQS